MREESIEIIKSLIDGVVATEHQGKIPSIYIPDKWVASSLMQKAIRRGDVMLTSSAVDYLLLHDRNMLRRRLAVIALEDVGLGNVDAVLCSLMICNGARYLPRGTFLNIVKACAVRLAQSAKERSGDYIICACESHPDKDSLREELSYKNPANLSDLVLSHDTDLVTKSLAAWYLAGTIRSGSERLHQLSGDIDLYWWTVEQLNIPFWVVDMMKLVSRGMRFAFPIHLPIKYAQAQMGALLSAINQIPTPVLVNGLPTYSLGSHTRLGKSAIRQFLNNDNEVTRFLHSHLARKYWQKTYEGAFFNVEAGLVDSEFYFDGYEQVKQLGVEADVCIGGLRLELVDEFLKLVNATLPTHDAYRVKILKGLPLSETRHV